MEQPRGPDRRDPEDWPFQGELNRYPGDFGPDDEKSCKPLGSPRLAAEGVLANRITRGPRDARYKTARREPRTTGSLALPEHFDSPAGSKTMSRGPEDVGPSQPRRTGKDENPGNPARRRSGREWLRGLDVSAQSGHGRWQGQNRDEQESWHELTQADSAGSRSRWRPGPTGASGSSSAGSARASSPSSAASSRRTSTRGSTTTGPSRASRQQFAGTALGPVIGRIRQAIKHRHRRSRRRWAASPRSSAPCS